MSPLRARSLAVLGLLTLLGLTASCTRPGSPDVASASAPSAARPQSTPPAVSRETQIACCRQCLQASSRDPAGFDISIRACTHYRGEWHGGPGVDAECSKLLQQEKLLVKGCRALVEGNGP